MLKARCSLAIAILLATLSPLAAQSTAATESALEITIVAPKQTAGVLEIDEGDGFRVIFRNSTNKLIRLWDSSTTPGWAALSFRITDPNGKSWTMRKTWSELEDWADYFPKSNLIAPNQTLARSVFPWGGQGEGMIWTDFPEPNTNQELSLTAIFEIKDNAKTREHGIWTGRIESKPVKARFVNPTLRTPHKYLWRRCPEQALKMMQEDRSWIHKEESESFYTPLHLASRYSFPHVVEWLLANGAEVDAKAVNDNTPLYYASEPAVVRAILKHKPKDTKAAAEFFRYPLEHAAEQVAWGRWETKKWREIVQLMLDAGAPCTLQIAAYLNDVDRIREVLKENPNLANTADKSRYTPLRAAARYGHADICKILLEHKADPNDWKNGVGYPILHDAIKHPAVVKLLLDAGADIKKRITWRGGKTGYWIVDDDATALHFAAQDGAAESAKLLLAAGIDVDAKDTRDQTALDIAARCGQAEVFQLIVKRVASSEEREKGWRRLLQQLGFSGQADALKSLLGETAVLEILPREGPALMKSAARQIVVNESRRHAQENGRNRAFIELLLVRGISTDIYTAITMDDIARVRELLKNDPALANEKDPDKRPVLCRAVALDRRDIATLLLNAGADANAVDEDGYVALHSAAFWGRPEIAKLLIEHRANVNARRPNGCTPLHEAARLGNPAVARLLLAAGANVNATDDKGRTPLAWVAGFGEYAEITQVLIEHGGKK